MGSAGGVRCRPVGPGNRCRRVARHAQCGREFLEPGLGNGRFRDDGDWGGAGSDRSARHAGGGLYRTHLPRHHEDRPHVVQRRPPHGAAQPPARYESNRQTHIGAIRDRQNPSNHSWIHDPGVPYSTVIQDYAVVSRFLNPLTEKMVVVVGGMGRDATIAAGEFVTDPRYLEMLASRAPRDWARKNLQVVLATDVVNGNTGPPRILATCFW